MDYTILTPSQLGPVLRSFRKQRGMTQAELGEKIALLQAAISSIETQPGKVNVERLFRILSGLDLELVLREKTRVSQTSEVEW